MTPIRRHRSLLLVATALTYLLIVAGGAVCVTGSTLGCPDWPGCYGRAIPPLRADAIVEYTHRAVAGLSILGIVSAAGVGWNRRRTARWAAWAPIAALPLLAIVVALGALAVVQGIGRGWAVVDLGSALGVLALMVVATVAVFRQDEMMTAQRSSRHSPFGWLALAAALAVFAVFVSAVAVAPGGSLARCLGWPLYGGGWAPADSYGWLLLARRLAGIVAGFLVVGTVVQAWRTQRGRRVVLGVATAAGALLIAEAAVGAAMAAGVLAVPLLVSYVALAAGLWALLAALVALASPAVGQAWSDG